MRVLHVATHFSLYVTTLMRGSPATTHAYLPARNYLAEVGADAGTHVELFEGGGFRAPHLMMRTIRRFQAKLAEFQPDIVHFQETPTPLAVALWGAAHAYPRVLTVHDVIPHPGRDARGHLNRYLWGRTRLSAEAVIVHAEGLRRELIEVSGVHPTRAWVIPHPAMPVGPGPASVSASPVALMIGRMETYKGLEVLLDALGLLESDISIDVVIAGAGPELDRLENRLAALPRVTVVNRFLTPTEMDGLLRSASLLIAPYREASASGILSQAQSINLPVIASNVGAFSEYVEPGVTGWLIPPGDPAALADRLRDLAKCPGQLLACRISIAKTVRDRFAPHVVGAKTLETYHTVLECKQ